MKKIKFLIALVLGSLFTNNASSQMVGINCYMKGNLVEVGIDGAGGYEGVDTFVSAPLPGMHYRSGTQYFGFVANPQVNGWLTFDGDFFTPGTPENGWGFECIDAGGVSNPQSNNRAGGLAIPGSLGSSWSMIGTCIQADWNGTYVGTGYNISFHINYYLNTPDLFYTTTVTVTNNGSLIPDFYYYRNFDPDNNEPISFDFTTQNTIVSQPGGGCNLAHVKATSVLPASQPMSYVGMAAVGSQFRVSKGGFSNRDASNIWNGIAPLVGTVGSTSFADEAISLAYRIQNFAAGASETFKFVVILDDAAASNAISNLFYVTYPGSGASASVCNPTIDTVVTCPGVGVPIGVAGSALASFSWSWSPTAGLSPTTGATVTASPATSTLYTVTGTPLSPCFSPVNQQIFVKVTAPPTITCPAPPVMCSGASASLTATGAGVGGTYSWSPATGLSATTGATVTANPATTTTYTITGTTASGCVGTTTVTVTIGGSAVISCPSATKCASAPAVTLTATGAGVGGTYSWSPATGLSGTTGASVTANPASTTTYTITGTTSAGCTGTTTTTVTVNPLPTVTCPSVAICNGSSTALTASGASTYAWSPATGLSATAGTTVTASPATTTTYTITGTSAAGCTNTGTVTVTVNALPVVTCPNATMCPAGSATLTASGASTYSWSPATGLSATTGTTVTATPGATTIYTVTGTDINGCVNTTTTTVTVAGTATITVAPATICNGSSTTLTATGGVTYIWSPATGLSATTGSSVTANPATTTTYTINGTDASGCSGTTTSVVTVNPIPVVTVAPATICNGSSTTLTASGATTYAWSPATGLSATTGTSVTANPTSTTTYTIDGTSLGCTGTTTATVTVNPIPDVIATPPSQTLCSGGTTAINLSSSVLGTTFSWTVVQANVTGASAGAGASIAQTLTTIVPPSGTATYTITPTAAGCVGAPVDVIITMQEVAITSINTTPALCFGSTNGTITVNATGATQFSDDGGITFQPSNVFTVGAGSYNITVDNGSGCQATGTATVTEPTALNVPISTTPETCFGACDGIGGTAPSGGTSPYTYSWTGGGITPFFTGLCTGSYTVIVTDANGCTGSNTAVITGPVAVSITSVTPTQPSCNGASNGSIVVNASGTVSNYSIDCGSTFQPSNTFGGLPAGTYCVTVQDAAGCSASQNITVGQPTALGVNPGATSTICFGQTATVSATGTGATPGYSYAWTDASGNPVGATASAIVTPNLVGANVYTVNVTDANGCGPVTTTVTVTMTPPLSVTASADVSVCPGDQASISTVSATGGTGSGYTYTWTNSADATVLNGSSQTVTSVTGSTTYTITLSDGCSPSVTDQVVVNWFALPGVSYTLDNTQGCTPVIVNFASTTSAGATATYSWDFGDGNTSTSANPTNVFVGSGCYNISLNIVTSDGCVVDTVINNQVCVFDIPVPDFSFNPQPTDVFNTEINFTNLTLGGSTYSWDFAGLGSSTNVNPSFTFPADGGGTYSVCLSTVSNNGCAASICHDVIILDQFIIYVPNTFTPDGDGINDIFLPIIQGENPLSYELFIFDRWGEVIFQSNNLKVGWDGTYKNVSSKEDVYVWKIRVKKSTNEDKMEYRGHINLLR